MYRADLSGANLTGADLTGVDLTEANLKGADLRGVIIDDQTNFDGADLTDVKGLTPELAAQLRKAGAINVPNVESERPNSSPNSLSTDSSHLLSLDPLTQEQLRQIRPEGYVRMRDDGTGRFDVDEMQQTRLPTWGSAPEQPGPTTQPATNPPGSTSSPAPTTNQGGGVVIAPPLLTRDQKLQLMRDLGIDPTGIRPDLLDDPELKRLLREFQKTGDQKKARNDLEKWLKLKGFDLTPDGKVVPHTGHGSPPNLEMPQTRFPLGPDPLLTQALSNLKDSNNPADLVRQWSKEPGAPKLRALLTQAGLEQVLSYGLGGTLLKVLSQGGLSRFLSAYNTEGVLRTITNDPQAGTAVRTAAQVLLPQVSNVLNEARLAPLKSAINMLQALPTGQAQAALVQRWAQERDPRFLLLLGTREGLNLVLNAGMGGAFLNGLAEKGLSRHLRDLNTAPLLEAIAAQQGTTPLGQAAQNLLGRVNHVLQASTASTQPPRGSPTSTDPLKALNHSIQSLRQATPGQPRIQALQNLREQIQGLTSNLERARAQAGATWNLLQQQTVSFVLEKLQDAQVWLSDPKRVQEAQQLGQAAWQVSPMGIALTALAGVLTFLPNAAAVFSNPGNQMP